MHPSGLVTFKNAEGWTGALPGPRQHKNGQRSQEIIAHISVLNPPSFGPEFAHFSGAGVLYGRGVFLSSYSTDTQLMCLDGWKVSTTPRQNPTDIGDDNEIAGFNALQSHDGSHGWAARQPLASKEFIDYCICKRPFQNWNK